MKVKNFKGGEVKRIIIAFYNSFTGEEYSSYNSPYNRIKASNGFYSKLCKKARSVNAECYNAPKRLVKTKLTLIY